MNAELSPRPRTGTLATLDDATWARLLSFAEAVTVEKGEALLREGDSGRDFFLLLEGEVCLLRDGVEVTSLGPGTPVGVLGLLTGQPRAASLIARTRLSAARLSYERWKKLTVEEPRLALEVTNALFVQVRDELLHITAQVGRLLQERSLPRSAQVTVRVGDSATTVKSGTTLRQLLPAEVDGELVVAGLLDNKPVSLNTAVVSAAEVRPLTVSTWEGRRVFAHSLGLLLLEAAHRVRPGLTVRLGQSLGAQQRVEVPQTEGLELTTFASALGQTMQSLAVAATPLRQEHWAVEEARSYFLAHGWVDAAKLLETHRQATVSLSSMGEVYALSMGPLVPNTEMLLGFQVLVDDGALYLNYGARDPRTRHSRGALKLNGRDMSKDHRGWLEALGCTSLGDFNALCVSGQVADLVRVAEGFHEKTIGHLADTIEQRSQRVRIICIAGPSSSGKSTFIKRLKVQLQINGLRPRGLSIDDYYVDREATPKDAKGEYDFEALEALNLTLFQEHVARLLRGETVKTAHYDFKSGKSHPEGGPEMTLLPGDVLMLEGIHGLNPLLMGDASRPEERFLVFVHPATSLAVDRLTRVSPSDLRLLRRIVRDRHGRGYKAADNILRWPSVQAGEQKHIFPFMGEAHAVFDTSLVYEPAVLKVYAERYLLEVPREHPAWATAWRLRLLIDQFVAVYPDHVPPTSLIREFIGGSGFEY